MFPFKYIANSKTWKGVGGGLVGWSGGETFPTCAKDGKFILYFLQSKWIHYANKSSIILTLIFFPSPFCIFFIFWQNAITYSVFEIIYKTIFLKSPDKAKNTDIKSCSFSVFIRNFREVTHCSTNSKNSFSKRLLKIGLVKEVTYLTVRICFAIYIFSISVLEQQH